MTTEKVAGRRIGRRGVYKDVYRHFAQLIDNGQMKPGERLPSSPRIAEAWDISHATAAKALQLLRDERYVKTTAKGTFVAAAKSQRLFETLTLALNALEKERQALQLESNERGTCIMGRDGGVCWNALTDRWESADA
jgi:DNA-binding GntR family transcriptional regulator